MPLSGLTLPPVQPSLQVMGSQPPSAGTTKAESFARNARDPKKLIQVMLA